MCFPFSRKSEQAMRNWNIYSTIVGEFMPGKSLNGVSELRLFLRRAFENKQRNRVQKQQKQKVPENRPLSSGQRTFHTLTPSLAGEGKRNILLFD